MRTTARDRNPTANGAIAAKRTTTGPSGSRPTTAHHAPPALPRITTPAESVGLSRQPEATSSVAAIAPTTTPSNRPVTEPIDVARSAYKAAAAMYDATSVRELLENDVVEVIESGSAWVSDNDPAHTTPAKTMGVVAPDTPPRHMPLRSHTRPAAFGVPGTMLRRDAPAAPATSRSFTP